LGFSPFEPIAKDEKRLRQLAMTKAVYSAHQSICSHGWVTDSLALQYQIMIEVKEVGSDNLGIFVKA
jgi:hypothetical protein